MSDSNRFRRGKAVVRQLLTPAPLLVIWPKRRASSSPSRRLVLTGVTLSVLMACSSPNMAQDAGACGWSTRAKLNDEEAALLSLMFASAEDRYRPLRLRVNAGRDFVQGAYVADSYAVVDRARPFELRVNYSGMLTEGAVPSFVRERLYLDKFTYLDYPRHMIVIDEADYDPSYAGYLNITPISREKFEDKNFSDIQKILGTRFETRMERNGDICRFVYQYSDNGIERVSLFVNYDYDKEDKRLQFSLCEARAYAMLSGYAAYTIPRIEKAYREGLIDVPGKGTLPFSVLIRPLADAVRDRSLQAKKIESFGEVCGFILSKKKNG